MVQQEKMIERLIEAFSKPNQRFLYYSGNNHPEIATKLGLDIWDWTPQKTLNIEPFYWNTHTLALAFGCKPRFTSEGKEWIEPLINDPSQIEQIIVPDVMNGRTGEILSIMKKMSGNLQPGELIRMPDIQSPMGVAELIMGDALYFALLTNADELHGLLEKITEFTITYIRKMKEVCGKSLNACCHPQVWAESDGFYISDDTNSMVSPEMHAEFSVQYINRIIDACGPVFYHSCTWTTSYITNMHTVKNKKGINWSFGTSMDPAAIITEMSGKTVLIPHIGADTHKEEGIRSLGKNITDEADLVEYLIASMQDNTTIYMNILDSLSQKPEVVVKIYRILHKHGFTPQSQGL